MPKDAPPAYGDQLDDQDTHHHHYHQVSGENKIARTVIIGILYFVFGAATCLAIFGLLIAYLMS